MLYVKRDTWDNPEVEFRGPLTESPKSCILAEYFQFALIFVSFYTEKKQYLLFLHQRRYPKIFSFNEEENTKVVVKNPK